MGTKGNMIYLPTEDIRQEFKKYLNKTAEGIFGLMEKKALGSALVQRVFRLINSIPGTMLA